MKRRTRRVLAMGTAVSTLTLGLAAVTAATPAQAATPTHAFPSHQVYRLGVMPSASQAARDAAVEKQYNSWKSAYLVHGCASNEYYVSTKGDGDAPDNGPVSEGQGYGMNIVPLMAGYDPNAQTEFNGLWQLVKDHEDQYGLMQWQLDGKSCKYTDSGTPDAATDGDLDIGYGLILADAQWGGYRSDALSWLTRFWNHDVAPDGHLKCEDDGPNTDTRPSDHMIDHLRAFAAYDSSHDWSKVIQRTEAVDASLVGDYSSSYGLLSDFVVGADTSSPSPAPAAYQENQPDNIVGYNSIRVPWHMGTDALVNGASSAAFELSEAKKWSACAKKVSGGNPANVYPHLKLNCTAYSTSDVAEEAGDSIGPSAMAAGDQAWTDAIWNYLQTNPYGDAYYGETIKTLVMIVMAGDWWSPGSSAPPPTGGCAAAQLLANPGFESGGSGWSQASTLGFDPITQATSAEPAHSGSWIAWFNGNATKDTDTITQSATIPSGCTATLTYWLHVDSTENTGTATPDTFKVQVLSSSGTLLGTVGSFSNLDAAAGYAQHSADLSAYAGQTVTVKFTGSETDTSGGTTDFVVDDTALNAA